MGLQAERNTEGEQRVVVRKTKPLEKLHDRPYAQIVTLPLDIREDLITLFALVETMG